MLADALYLSLATLSTDPPIDPALAYWVTTIASSPPVAGWDVGWRPDASSIGVLMSDEEPQSYLSPIVTADDVIEVTLDASLYAFTPAQFAPHWAAFGMTWQKLEHEPGALFASLTAILDAEACK